MLVIEEHCVEILAHLIRQVLAEVGVDVARTTERLAGLELTLAVALGNLEDGGELVRGAGGEAVGGDLGRRSRSHLAEALVARGQPLAEHPDTSAAAV